MADHPTFNPLAPGFDFLQNLVKNAGSAMPAMGQWIAPTINPEELEKRIGELRTVQFWLEQNARMLSSTIQALEVQRMTLSTLKNMNVQMGDLSESLRARASGSAAAAAPNSRSATDDAAASAAEPSSAEPETSSQPAAVDPMQWWGALTQQFTELAASAMKDHPGAAAVAAATERVKAAVTPTSAPAAKRKASPSSTARKTAARPAAKKRAAPKT